MFGHIRVEEIQQLMNSNACMHKSPNNKYILHDLRPEYVSDDVFFTGDTRFTLFYIANKQP